MPAQSSPKHCVIKASSVDQALRILSRFSDTPHPEVSRSWFFRGQKDSEWGLVPSIFRGGESTAGRDLRAYENDLLFWLKSVLERRSEIPARYFSFNGNAKDIPSAIDRGECDWLLAFARHQGAPTRVLDWTRSHQIAAWFAAKDVWDYHDANRYFSVFVGAHRQERQETQHDGGVRWMNPSGAANPYLSAQRGILVLHDWSVQDQWETSQNRVIDEGELQAELTNGTALFRIDVAWTEAFKMMQSVQQRGIDGVSMFPGNFGYVEQAKMWSNIRRLIPPQSSDG